MRLGCPVWIAIFVSTAMLAGCVEQPSEPRENDQEPSGNYEDSRIKINDTGDAARDWVPNLQEPPQLVRGQYWRIEVQLGWGLGARVVDVVVAGKEDDHWLIGMPTHDFSNDIMVLHIPGLGQVRQATLGFEAHDVWLEPLRFPLTEGDTWTTGFMSEGNLVAEVTRIDGLNATIEMRNPEGEGGYTITVEYDAAMRTVREFTAYAGDAIYGSYKVLEHGYDWHEVAPEWDGIVTVPHMSDLIFCHGDLAGLPLVRDCKVSQSPHEDAAGFEIDIDPDYDRVSFANILVSVAPPVSGYYEVRTTAPDGTDYFDSLTPLDGVTAKLVSYKHDMPGGTWRIEAVAAGPGQAFMEGIGYHVYDVELPSGRILPSIGAHEHGSDQGH